MSYIKTLTESARVWLRLEMGHDAAAFSYYATFALAPLILISLGVSSIVFGLPFVRNIFLNWGMVLDPNLTAFMSVAVQNLDIQVNTYSIPLVATVFFAFTGIMAFNALGLGFERIWGKREISVRAWLRQSARSTLFIALLQICLLILIGVEGLWASLAIESRLVPMLIWFISITTIFFLLYRFLIAGAPRFLSCLIGAITAGILFSFAKGIVTLYLAAKPVLGIFGAAGLLLVLLIWVYVLASIIYYGAIVAATNDRKYG